LSECSCIYSAVKNNYRYWTRRTVTSRKCVRTVAEPNSMVHSSDIINKPKGRVGPPPVLHKFVFSGVHIKRFHGGPPPIQFTTATLTDTALRCLFIKRHWMRIRNWAGRCRNLFWPQRKRLIF